MRVTAALLVMHLALPLAAAAEQQTPAIPAAPDYDSPTAWAAGPWGPGLSIAMAGKLKGPVVLGKEVVAIESLPQWAEVRCADGSIHRARPVICSLPFATLRHVHFAPALVAKQAEAVAMLPYQPITIAMLKASEPFW